MMLAGAHERPQRRGSAGCPQSGRCAGWGSGDVSRPPVFLVASVPKAVRSGFAQDPSRGRDWVLERRRWGQRRAAPAWESEPGVPDPPCATLEKSVLTGAVFRLSN